MSEKKITPCYFLGITARCLKKILPFMRKHFLKSFYGSDIFLGCFSVHPQLFLTITVGDDLATT